MLLVENPNDKTLEMLDWQNVLDALSAKCQSYYGRTRVENNHWLNNVEDVRQRYRVISELNDIHERGFRLPFGGVTNCEEGLGLLENNRLLELEYVREIRDCLLGLRYLRDYIRPHLETCPNIDLLVSTWNFPDLLCQKLEHAFQEDGELSPRQFPRLAIFRNRIQEMNRNLDIELQRLLSEPSVTKMLQEHFITQRNGRHVLPVKANFKRSFGIVHGRSQSGETFFVEPLSVLPIANAITENELALEQEIRNICVTLSRSIAQEKKRIHAVLEAVGYLDECMAACLLGQFWDGVRPEVNNDGVIHLQESRHPVLLLQGEKVVANDFEINKGHPAALFSGPNAGGKTIALKQVGLMALLVRRGVPIPAKPGSRCDFFSSIEADIGDTQAVVEGLSTFSAKLVSLNEYLKSAKSGSLYLLDELGMGTDPAQGAALAQAVIETLISKESRVLVTTHFTRLKALAMIDSRFQVAAAQFYDGQPTYELEWGMMGQSYALDVAKRLGMSSDVIARAASLLKDDERNVAELVSELEQQQQALSQDQSHFKKQQSKLEELQDELRREKSILEQKMRSYREDVQREFRQNLWHDYQQLQAQIKKCREEPSIEEIRETAKSVQELRERTRPVEDIEEPVKLNLKVGQWVHVNSMSCEGQIQNIRQKKITVEVNGMRMVVKRKGLSKSRKRRERVHKETRISSRTESSVETELSSPRSVDNTCDLRGMRVEEGCDHILKFFDDAIISNDVIVYLLHGHGTGALKKGVRNFLQQCSRVHSWRPGNNSEGGDAFTRVQLY